MTTPKLENTALIREIKQEHLKMRIDKTKLEFSDKTKYNLVNLNIFEDPESSKGYKDLMVFHIDNNSLAKLVLKGYNKLDEVSASKNLITRVELNLNKLTKINLSNNFITTMFDLNFTPCLRELIMSDNSLSSIKFEDFRPVKGLLEKLDVSMNKIDFEDCNKFLDFAKNFGKNMKRLNSFNIIGNPFSEKKAYREYSLIMISYFDVNLELFNNKDTKEGKRSPEMIQNLEKKMRMVEEAVKKASVVTPGQNLDDFNLFGNTKNEIELSDIVKKTAKLTTLGKMTITTLKELQALVNQYLNKKKANLSSEKEEIEDPEINEFENFLDLINILIDTSPMFEKAIYYLVCDFINVQNGKFSARIITYLKQRIFSEKSDEMQMNVIEHLERRMDFRNNLIDNVSPNLIIGMETLITNPVFAKKQSFIELTKKIVDYITKVEGDIKLINCRQNHEFKKKETFSSLIVYLISASNIPEHFIWMIQNLKFLERISKQIKVLLSETIDILLIDNVTVDTLIKMLGIMKNMFIFHKNFFKPKRSGKKNQGEADEEEHSKFDPNSILQKILGGGLRDKIEQTLNLRFQELTKKNAEKDFNLNKFNVIFALITCYGGLINGSNDILRFIKDEKSTPYKIMNFLVNNESYDPCLIRCTCEFVLFMLENEQIFKLPKNSVEFKKILKNLYGLRYVLPYLVYDKAEYKNACIRAEKYGQTTIVRGKPVELSSLNSEIMFSMIISIVKLIEYFGRNTKNECNITDDCRQFCKELQDQKKDISLCMCLNVPNEKVKKAIVESLYSMDCSQFKGEEIGAISKQLMDVSLSGQNIEFILSIIFLILDQCFKSFIHRKDFERLKQNKEIFNLALDILLKNNERVINLDFIYRKKTMLNCAISSFMLNCCRNQLVNNFFNDKGKTKKMCEILQLEEKNVFPTPLGKDFPYYIPIEVEKIRSGFKIENLILLLTNENYLTPFTYISTRIMIHIADLLMNIMQKEIEMNANLEFEDLMKEIHNDFSEREYKRVLIESMSFQKFLDYKRSLHHENLFNHGDLKNEQRNFYKKFDVIMKYIKGETNNKMNMKFSFIWKNKFHPDFDDHIDEEDENQYRNRIDQENRDYFEKYQREMKHIEEYKSINLEGDVKADFITNLRKEEYFSILENFNDSEHVMKEELENYESYTRKKLTVIRRKEEEDPNNPYLRCMFLAAFLRSIFALLEFPCDMEIKNGIIAKLKEKNNLRDISRLVESCVGKEFNIASKFITIIKYILLKPTIINVSDANQNHHKDTPIEEDETLCLIEEEKNIKYISSLVKKIVLKVESKITIEKDDDKILLYNICQCASVICNKLNFNHSDISRVKAFNDSIRKSYILSKKLDEYVHISIIELFIKKIIEYMNKENLYFLQNSRKLEGEKGEEVKKGNIKGLEQVEEDDDLVHCDDVIELEERINNSKEVQMLNILTDNVEKKNENDNQFKIDDFLINMISNIPLFLGEYMSKCNDEKVYQIFENFTRSGVFLGINIRKSYIKEIIDFMNLSKKRKLISRDYKTNLITRANFIDFEEKNSKWYLMFLMDQEIKLQEIDGSVPEKDELIEMERLKMELKDEEKIIKEISENIDIKKEEEYVIPYSLISNIYRFEVKNRIMIKIIREKPVFKLLFFKKFYMADLVIDFIKLNNCNVVITDPISIFVNDEEKAKLEEQEKIREKIEENRKKKEENLEMIKKDEENNENSTANDNLINPNESNKEKEIDEIIKNNENDEKLLEKIKEEENLEKLKKDPNASLILYCNIPLKGFLDFFLNLFKTEKEILEKNSNSLTDNRLLRIDGTKFEIYNELTDKFYEMSSDCFREETQISLLAREMRNCYSLHVSKDVSSITSINYKLNVINISIDGSDFEIHCFDDFSVVKLKSCIFYHQSKNIQIKNKENYEILERR